MSNKFFPVMTTDVMRMMMMIMMMRRRRFEGVFEDSRLKGYDMLCCWVHGSRCCKGV
jgi:hypothetical protein